MSECLNVKCESWDLDTENCTIYNQSHIESCDRFVGGGCREFPEPGSIVQLDARDELCNIGFEPVFDVLMEALEQTQGADSKGMTRHGNGKSFMEQPIILDGRVTGPAGAAFQARKKILEALNCPDVDSAVRDLLGAIIYTVSMVILKRETTEDDTTN